MTVLCGVCNAENRDAAKFCKGCGRKIAQAWPQPAPVAVGVGEAAVLLGTAAPVPRTAPAPAPPAPVLAPEFTAALAPSRPRIGNGRWIAGLAVGVVMLMLMAAWWGHRNQSQEIAEPAMAAPEPAVSAPAAPPAPTSEAASAKQVTIVPGENPRLLELAEESAPSLVHAPAKPRKPVAKKQSSTPPAPVVEAVAPSPPPPAPEPRRVSSPQDTCAGRNFIARAQCMADQCARPEVAGHPQCDAVRRQQRIDEEKRNPTMAG